MKRTAPVLGLVAVALVVLHCAPGVAQTASPTPSTAPSSAPSPAPSPSAGPTPSSSSADPGAVPTPDAINDDLMTPPYLTVTPGTGSAFRGGSEVRLEALFFQRDARVLFFLDSRKRALGSAVTSERRLPDGRTVPSALLVSRLPADLEAGKHVVVAAGRNGDGAAITLQQVISVAAASTGPPTQLPATGRATDAFVIGGGIALLLGAALLTASGRRPRRDGRTS